jgi:hypothetical protein
LGLESDAVSACLLADEAAVQKGDDAFLIDSVPSFPVGMGVLGNEIHHTIYRANLTDY